MDEFAQSETPSPNFRALLCATLWLSVAAIVVAAGFAFSSHHGWTRVPLWAPFAFVAAVASYNGALALWLEWGKQRRANGRAALFGLRWRVGATRGSDLYIYGMFIAGFACVVSAAVSGEIQPGALMLAILPALWAYDTQQGATNDLTLPAIVIGTPSLMVLSVPVLQMRHYGSGPASVAIALLFGTIAFVGIAASVLVHAKGAWIAEHETESPAA